jgi:RimJ/RimL family protein N-acetyltransferase
VTRARQPLRWRLRALDAGDAGLYAQLYGDARTMRYIGPPLSRRACRDSLRETLRRAQAPRGPRLLTIIDARDGAALGICALQPVARRCVELGIMLTAAARGTGIAHECAGALIDAAFETLPIGAVWVQYHVANAAARRVFAGLGFVPGLVPRPRSARRGFEVAYVARSAWSRSSHPGGKSMSSIIEFLENMGRDAGLRHASAERLQQAMQEQRIAPHLRAVLLAADAQGIESLIGTRERVYCATFPVRVPKKAPGKTPKKPVKAPPKPAKRPAKAPAKPKRGGKTK